VKKQKILITGGAGGIGSTFINSLSDSYQIDVVDNLHNGFKENIKNENINFIESDISNPKTYSLLTGNYDCVFHLAAVSSLPFCENNKETAIRYNFLGTMLLIEYCRINGIKNFVFASTSAVYENNSSNIFTENLTVNPDLIYPLSKKISEDLLKSYIKNYDMSITILRFFNVFGPNQDFTRSNPPLLNYLIREYSLDRVPILHSDGKQARDYIYVQDLVTLFLKIIDKPSKEIFNVCTGQLLSVNEMNDFVAKYFKKNPSDVIRNNPEKLWDTYPELFSGNFSLKKERVAKETLKYSLGDNTKVKDYYDWNPNLDFESLITKTIEDSIS
jgi:UDP-glucose 4-epimerase